MFVYTPNIKVYYLFIQDDTIKNHQFGFAVAKKLFPKAKDRNRIKRLLREQWRLKKHDFNNKLDAKSLKCILWFNYVGKEIPTFDEIGASLDSFLVLFNGKHEIN